MSADPGQVEATTPELSEPASWHDGSRGLFAVLLKWIRQIPPSARRAIPLAVLAIGASIQIALWVVNAGDATRQVMSSWYMMPTTAFLLVLWWVFISEFTWAWRLTGLALLGAAVLTFFGLFRLKEFTGDMVPRFESRWKPSAEDRAARYFNEAIPPIAPATDKAARNNSLDVPPFPVGAEDWPQFEGPARDGVLHGSHLRTDWNVQRPRAIWRHPVGAAWSSFAVVGKYAFTQEQRGRDEAVVCYDADTGKQLWVHLDRGVRFSAAMAGTGPRATPTVFGSRVYTLGAQGSLNCFEPMTGRLLWSTNCVEDAGEKPLQFGMAGSPLAYENVVVVNPGGPRTTMTGTKKSGRALIAYDRITGKQIWAAGDYQAAYASPILATIAGTRQIVIFDGLGAAGHDAETGRELWRSEEWTNEFHNNIAQPIVVSGDRIFFSSGYSTGSLLLDISKPGTRWTATTRLKAPNRFKLKFNSGVCRSDCVYGLDEGILACFDLESGKELWKKGRYKYGQVLLLDDKLLVTSEEGDVILLDISRDGSRETARFHAIDGKTWNYPSISRGRLYVRNGEEAACFDLNATGTPIADSGHTGSR